MLNCNCKHQTMGSVMGSWGGGRFTILILQATVQFGSQSANLHLQDLHSGIHYIGMEQIGRFSHAIVHRFC